MAKIDLSKIEGYADMTAEQKLAALEGLDLPEANHDGYVKKELFDKKASELAEANRKLGEKMTEEEKAKEEREKELASLQEKVATLEKEKLISGYKAKYVAQGMDEELASKTASALATGDHDTVFANEKAFLEAYAKKIRTDALGDVGKPPAGGGGSDTEDVAFAKKLAAASNTAAQSVTEGMKNYL